MRTKKLGQSDLNFSLIGLGTWGMGGAVHEYSFGPQDDRESLSTIHRAMDHGINWIDTAPMYGLGHSEEVVGKAIKQKRDKIFIATKCGVLWDDNNNYKFCLKKDSIRIELETSLKRLGTDVIDLYQIHEPNPDEQIEEAWQTIADLIKEGKVRYGGVSNFSLEQLKRLQRILPVVSIQLVYNLFNRDIESDLLAYCSENDIGAITYSPLCSGLITDKINKERISNLHSHDIRSRLPDFQDPYIDANLKCIERLKIIADRNVISVLQLAVAWALRHREIKAIVGARQPAQIEGVVPSIETRLSDEDLNEIDNLLAERSSELKSLRSGGIFDKISSILKVFLSNFSGAEYR